jgi:hypothetical protein
MNKTTKFSSEVRERAVRLVFEQEKEHEWQWAAIGAIECAPGAAGPRGRCVVPAGAVQARVGSVAASRSGSTTDHSS